MTFGWVLTQAEVMSVKIIFLIIHKHIPIESAPDTFQVWMHGRIIQLGEVRVYTNQRSKFGYFAD